MADDSPKTLSLTILDREYRVNCPDGAEDELRQAARYLNDRMVEIKQAGSNSGKILGTDRIAVIAALNISHQLLTVESELAGYDAKVQSLNEAVDDALTQDLQMEL